jgi:hypothetical protein
MTISSQSQDLAINVMLTAQAKENTVTVAPRLTLVKAPKAAKEVSSSTGKNQVSAPGISFDNRPGDYTATEFMMRYRRARDRNEMMVAINGFTGYDNKVAFSVNEYNARTAAQKALKPVPVAGAVIKAETKGYVAGIPDNNLKRISDLLGREKLAAEALRYQKTKADWKSLLGLSFYHLLA